MELSNKPDYRYYKTYLYPACVPSGDTCGPWGSAEVEITGHKGRLICRTKEYPGPVSTGSTLVKFPVMLCHEGGDEIITIGCLEMDETGQGSCTWDFSTDRQKSKEQDTDEVKYRLIISAQQDNAQRGEVDGMLLSGKIGLPTEVRDHRVIGFKKEATADRSRLQAGEKNPIFQRVEPFQPPMPHMLWWQISIQPNFAYYPQAEYCPRQKTYKAVF